MSLMTALIRRREGRRLNIWDAYPASRGQCGATFCGTDATHQCGPLPTQGQLSLPHLLTQALVQFQRVPLAQWVKPGVSRTTQKNAQEHFYRVSSKNPKGAARCLRCVT